jgi:Flp pilus assembly protein CpaB
VPIRDTRLADAADSMLGGQHHEAPFDGGGVSDHTSPPRARRRAALPSGRAVLGGLLVAVAMVAAYVAASGATAGPAGRAVVADRRLPIGHRIEAEDLRLAAVDVPADAADRLFGSPEALVGARTTADLQPGDLILRSTVVAGDDHAPDTRAFSFPVDRERAADGHLQPGERVDVLATFGTGDAAHTEVVASGVRLLDVEELGKATIGSSGKVVVTVALAADADVVRATQASQVASVTVILSPDGDGS